MPFPLPNQTVFVSRYSLSILAHYSADSSPAFKLAFDWLLISFKPSLYLPTDDDIQSECPNVKNHKWRLNPVWHRTLYSCTHMATVGVKRLMGMCQVISTLPKVYATSTVWDKLSQWQDDCCYCYCYLNRTSSMKEPGNEPRTCIAWRQHTRHWHTDVINVLAHTQSFGVLPTEKGEKTTCRADMLLPSVR